MLRIDEQNFVMYVGTQDKEFTIVALVEMRNKMWKDFSGKVHCISHLEGPLHDLEQDWLENV